MNPRKKIAPAAARARRRRFLLVVAGFLCVSGIGGRFGHCQGGVHSERPEMNSGLSRSDRKKYDMSEGNTGRLHYRVFRVMEEPENDCRSMIFEDLESRQFQWKGYFCFIGLPTQAQRQRIDRDDIWNVLNAMKNAQLASQYGFVFVSGADSLDMALRNGRAKRKESFERAREIYERTSAGQSAE